MMRLMSLVLILLTICSCNKEPENVITIYPAGFFTVDEQLYFSDGLRFYCGFRDWDHFYELRKTKEPPSLILEQKKLPHDMKYIKECNMGIITEQFFQ